MRNKNIYLFEIIFLIFIIILKFVFINKFIDIYGIVLISFLALFTFLIYKNMGFKIDNNSCKINAIQISIISLLLYILIIYLSGLMVGFLKNSYSLNIFSIIKNIYVYVFVIIFEEMIRWMIAGKCNKDKKPYYFLTLLFIILDIVLVYNCSVLISRSKLFVFISSTCLSIIARNVLCSYLCYKVSYFPGLIIRLFLTIYIFIVPIMPDLGNYFYSVIGVIFPYLVYLVISRLIQYAEKERPSQIKKNIWYVNVPIIFMLIFIVLLVSGLFKYQIMSIGSGSMEPLIYRGDAIIFEKIDDNDELDEGYVIVYKKNGVYITHRIISKSKQNGTFIYKTKGDNNINEDNITLTRDDIVGVVKLRLKYIGYPSLWFQELIS